MLAGLSVASVQGGTGIGRAVARRPRQAARAVFGDMGAGISPYPYVLIFSQDAHERLLVDRLREAGVNVERRTELLDFDEAARGITARLKRPDGSVETCAAAYLAGCDGAHSTVRDRLSIGFPGGTYSHLFYVADTDAAGGAVDGELHVALTVPTSSCCFRSRGRLTCGSSARFASRPRTSTRTLS